MDFAALKNREFLVLLIHHGLNESEPSTERKAEFVAVVTTVLRIVFCWGDLIKSFLLIGGDFHKTTIVLIVCTCVGL